MRRNLHPTPRHLDDPLRLGPFTVSQWVLLGLSAAVVWVCLQVLPAWVPTTARLSVAATLIGLPLGLVWAGGAARGILELPSRVLSYARSPHEYLPGRPRTGPLCLAVVETRTPRGDEPDDDE